MIELEIQGLSQSREGLLIEVGGFILASGFTLRRQRLVHDPHGILLTMVVSGSPRKRRALETALDGYDRFISVQVSPFVEGEQKPHFAVSTKQPTYVPPPAPEPMEVAAQSAPVPVAAPMTQPSSEASSGEPRMVAAISAPKSKVEALHAVSVALPEPDFEFILPTPHAPPPVVSVLVDPFIEVVDLGADEAAVDKALQSLEYDYPKIMPKLLALIGSVAEGARASSLALAGQRVGSWVLAREHALATGLTLSDALARIGTPALQTLVEVDQQDGQLRILSSPLCTADGHSGCSFFSGFLESLLVPVIAPGSLSIFPVRCRSCGGSECVLAISD